MSQRPFSQACENNKLPILTKLKDYCINNSEILEIGSGTGQHALFFADNLPHVIWQPSDLINNHEGIKLWICESQWQNIKSPMVLDVANKSSWPKQNYDLLFSANTLHIMSWSTVLMLFEMARAVLNEQAYFISYGPFNIDNEYTSESNKAFDQHLKSINPEMGIRDLGTISDECLKHRLILQETFEMPANNKLLVFRKINKND